MQTNQIDSFIKDASFRIRNVFNCCDVIDYHSYPSSWRIGAWENDSVLSAHPPLTTYK